MKRSIARARPAFTLIELLVVVAIIALLISILLPALRDAREQAKVARCLSNFRNLNVAATTYFSEHNDQFPFLVTYGVGWMGICSWAYGGKTSSDYWKTDHGGVFFITAQQRPFNRYLVSGSIEPDLYEGDKIIKRTEIEALKCPSDRESAMQNWENNQGALPISSYDDIGTSYRYNLFALIDVEWNGKRDPWTSPGSWSERGQLLVRQVLLKHPSTYTMFMDDAMIRGINNRLPLVGLHGRLNKHTVGFLDGHSAYVTADTRGYCGPDWVAINPEWIKGFGYTPRPAHYFDWLRKNCNPPRN